MMKRKQEQQTTLVYEFIKEQNTKNAIQVKIELESQRSTSTSITIQKLFMNNPKKITNQNK